MMPLIRIAYYISLTTWRNHISSWCQLSSFLIRAFAKLIDPVKFRHRNVFYWLKLRNGQRKSSFDKVNQTRFICDSISQLDNLVSSQSVWSKFCTKNNITINTCGFVLMYQKISIFFRSIELVAKNRIKLQFGTDYNWNGLSLLE